MNLTPGRRWLLFSLVLTAGILNLIDRQIISVLKPVISADLGWNDNDYGSLIAWYQAGAASGYLVTGWIVDRVGIKWANPLGVAAWSLVAWLHGYAGSFREFIVCRVALGATEAMGTPSIIKTIATIFPSRLRSIGIGLSNAISTIGVIFTPLVIPAIFVAWGWRDSFMLAGGAGLCWAGLWLICTRGIRFERAATVASDRDATIPPYGPILTERRTWAIAVAKAVSDATWWLMVFWLPDFFNRQFGLSGVELGPPMAIVFAGSAIGAVLAGTVSSILLKRGVRENWVHKSVMLASALCVLPVPLALQAGAYWSAVGLLSLALAGHQGFAVSLFALIADVTPKAKVGSVTSFCAFCGNLGGMAIAKIAGTVLAEGLGYPPLFLFASISYLLALGWIQLVLPITNRAEDNNAPKGLGFP